MLNLLEMMKMVVSMFDVAVRICEIQVQLGAAVAQSFEHPSRRCNYTYVSSIHAVR